MQIYAAIYSSQQQHFWVSISGIGRGATFHGRENPEHSMVEPVELVESDCVEPFEPARTRGTLASFEAVEPLELDGSGADAGVRFRRVPVSPGNLRTMSPTTLFPTIILHHFASHHFDSQYLLEVLCLPSLHLVSLHLVSHEPPSSYRPIIPSSCLPSSCFLFFQKSPLNMG